MSYELITQLIGYAGVICFILSFQIKSNKALYFTQMLGSAIFAIQFYMLGALTGCLNLFAVIIRNCMLLKINEWKWVAWKGWIIIWIIIYIPILVFTWESLLSLLPFAAMVAATIGLWSNNARTIRFANLVCISPCWMIYDMGVGSWAGVLNEAIVLASIIVSIYRYGWKAMGDPNSGF